MVSPAVIISTPISEADTFFFLSITGRRGFCLRICSQPLEVITWALASVLLLWRDTETKTTLIIAFNRGGLTGSEVYPIITMVGSVVALRQTWCRRSSPRFFLSGFIGIRKNL